MDELFPLFNPTRPRPSRALSSEDLETFTTSLRKIIQHLETLDGTAPAQDPNA